MSQIAGGRADKAGNTFERLWIVHLALEVVDGRALSIRWEPLGPEGAGVECEVRRADGTREKHQCKIENGTKSDWSAADLEPVLVAAKAHLDADPSTRFVFVSRDSARTLSDLAARARACDNNAEDFLKYCLTSTAHSRSYKSLCSAWSLRSDDVGDARIAIHVLDRITFERGFWEPAEKRILYRLAEAIAEGDGSAIVTYLAHHLEETLGNTLHSDGLRSSLRNAGHPPLDLVHDPRVPTGIARLQESFRAALEPLLIGSNLITRPEPMQLVTELEANGAARLIFVTGDAGSGKSSVLLEALRILAERGIPHLPIRLDTQYPDRTARSFGRVRLELPAGPAACLSSLAAGRRAVLAIDQLDAVRWTSANSDAGWEVCKAIIDEALAQPNISVVVSGRTMDLEEDPRIRHWQRARQTHGIGVQRLTVGAMPASAVAAVVESYGVEYESLTAREREILSNAQSLQLWWRLAEDGKARHFSSRAELLGSFWTHYRERAVQDYGVSQTDVNALLDTLVEFLDSNGQLNAPNTLLDRDYATASKALRALGILDRRNGTTRFVHQSHLDYLTIESVFLRSLRGGITPINWLKRHDQSLFRRDQVRFLMQLLRDQGPQLYQEFLEEVFFGSGTRFHIQHLALTTLAKASPPTDDEYALIKRLWHKDEWNAHVQERVLARHEPWLDRFTEDGTIPEMLASGNDVQMRPALFLCRRSADTAPQWFERVLTPYWDSGGIEWAERIEPLLAHDPAHDTAAVFQWRLERARVGTDDLKIYDADRLAKKDGVRAISYLAAIIDGFTSRAGHAVVRANMDDVRLGGERFTSLLEACSKNPRSAWNVLLSVHKRAATLHEVLGTGGFSVDTFRIRQGVDRSISLLQDFLASAGASLLIAEGASFLPELEELGGHPASIHARRLAVTVLASAPQGLADDALTCLMTIQRPLGIEPHSDSVALTDELSAQDPAVGTLRALSSWCSPAVLQRIEKEVLAFHAPSERESVQWQLDRIRAGGWGGDPNRYGLPQYALLLALPEGRLSVDGVRALRMWKSKFGDLSRYRTSKRLEALPIVSPIRADRVHLVSDRDWIRIVKGNWTTKHTRLRPAKDGAYVEASSANFAASLTRAGQSNPRRYVRLGRSFPPDSDDCYFTSLLHIAGLATRPTDLTDDRWLPAPIETIEGLIEWIADKQGIAIAESICRVVGERNGETWSAATRDLIGEYAVQHPNPDQKSSLPANGHVERSRSLEMTALNSVRCRAIHAASQLLWAQPDLLEWAKSLCNRVVEDPHPAVRAAALELVYAIAKHDANLATNLFVRSYNGTDDAVLGVQFGPHLLRVLYKRETELAPMLRRALASLDERVAELAAFWVSVGSIVYGIYIDLATQAASGAVPHRVGVARALVDIADHHAEQRAECLDRLALLANDSEDRVLAICDDIFSRDRFLDTEEAPAFAEVFVRSAAFTRDPTTLLHHLVEHEGSMLPFVRAIEASVEQLSGKLLGSTQNMGHRNAMAGHDIATIMLRLYQQSEAAKDQELRSRCLSQWDALLRARVGAGEEVVAKLDS